MSWNLDAGPLHFGSDGMGLRPQMKIGYGDRNCDIRIGIDDVRDGLSGGASGNVRRIYDAEGSSMEQVLMRLKAKSEIKVLDDLARIAPQLMSQIMKMTGVDIPPNSHIKARVIAKLGLGFGGGVCLGWADTKGFHMVGVKGSVSAAASVGADIMAGLHYTRKFVKAVLGISYVCVEVEFELPAPAQKGTAGTPGEETPIAAAAKVAAEKAAADAVKTDPIAGDVANQRAAAEAAADELMADAPADAPSNGSLLHRNVPGAANAAEEEAEAHLNSTAAL